MPRRCSTKTGCSYPRANWWKQSMGVDWFNQGDSVAPPVEGDIDSVESQSDIEVDLNTAFGSIPLPTTVNAVIDGQNREVDVTWAEGIYNSALSDSYLLLGTLTLPSGVTNSLGLRAMVNVLVNVVTVQDVPGLRYWFDGDNATLSGSNVEGLTNLKTAGNNAVKVSDPTRPLIIDNGLNGHDTIDFSPTQRLHVNVTNTETRDMTCIVVFKTNDVAGATRKTLISNRSADETQGILLAVFSNIFEFQNRNSNTTPFTDTTGWHVVTFKVKRYTTTEHLASFKIDNGTAVSYVGVTNLANNTTNQFNIGAGISGTQGWDGEIAEIIFVEDVVNETIERRIYQLLNTKYALSIPLTMPEYTMIGTAVTYSGTFFSEGFTNLQRKIAVSGKTFGKKTTSLILTHGYTDTFTVFTDAMLRRFANYGFFIILINMRGRGGASGARDASGRELFDIFDGVNAVEAIFTDLCETTRRAYAGYSGGGGNGYGLMAKFPEFISSHAIYFGPSDYGYDPADSWYFLNTAFQDELQVDIGGAAGAGGSPASKPNEYKSRDFIDAAVNNYDERVHVFHDEDDTDVDIELSNRFSAAMIAGGKSDNLIYKTTSAADAQRYTHAYPEAATAPGLVASEAYWLAQMLMNSRPAAATSGTDIVCGGLRRINYQIILGNGTAAQNAKNRKATVAFNTTTNSYTVTPSIDAPDTDTTVAITVLAGPHAGKTASGTIVGNTPTVFTPV